MSIRTRHIREVDYLTAEIITNDFIDNEMPRLKPAEIKLALVIRRKTIGWGQWSEWIGRTELCKRAKLDATTVKDAYRPMCKKLGITIERKPGGRCRYTWPLNERVAQTLKKARSAKEEGGKSPPTAEGQKTPDRGGSNPPTQLDTHKSNPRIGNRDTRRFNLGDSSAYVKGEPDYG